MTKVYAGLADCSNPKGNPHVFGAEGRETCLKEALLNLTENFLTDEDFLELLSTQ
jgi:hypothetical protein